MLFRVLPIFLLAVAALEVEETQAPTEVDERPRGERADGQLPPPRRPRPRPGSGSGFGSFLSGLLGSVTQTANVDSCPGKCIHALASLICDEVLEEVQCPSSNMRCCVEREDGMPPPPRENAGSLGGLNLGLDMPPKPKESDDSASEKKDVASNEDDEMEKEKDTPKIEEEETTTKKKKQKKRKKNKRTTTERTTTSTTTTTTTTTEAETTKDTTKKPKTTTESESEDDYDPGEYEYTSPANTSESSRFSKPNLFTISLIASVLTFLQTLKY